LAIVLSVLRFTDSGNHFVSSDSYYEKTESCNYFLFLNEENTLWILISEADTKSTWTEAMTKCRQQCSTIESDTTILKQHYLKVDEKFWLPTAVYKTTWTEQLGVCI
jgi:hypothetical protein